VSDYWVLKMSEEKFKKKINKAGVSFFKRQHPTEIFAREVNNS